MTIDGFTIDDFAAAEVVDDSISCSRFSIFNLTDARCLLEVDGAEPVLDERAAARAVGIVDPEILAEVVAVGHEALAVGNNTTDAAAGTRHNQSDVLPSHLGAGTEQVGLHDGGHLASPQRRDDDDVLIIGERC